MSTGSEIPPGHMAQLGDGRPISATLGVFPLLRELEKGKLQVVGTGFYITRYGLFLSARHVFDHITGAKNPSAENFRIFHHTGDQIHIRHVKRFTISNHADIALGEADNFSEQYPDNPLSNLRAKLTLETPTIGEKLITFAYPRNALLDFTNKSEPIEIFASRFEGTFEGIIDPGKYDPHQIERYQSSIPLEGGCSGGPIFDESGRVVAIAHSSLDFGDGDQEGVATSTLIPIRHGLHLGFHGLSVPKVSWEFCQIPPNLHAATLSVRDIAEFGHVEFDPPLG